LANGVLLFGVLNDIGIIAQLTRAIVEHHLPPGLIEAHFVALNHLSRRPQGQQASVMARALQLPKTSLSHTLRVLEHRGLIEQRSNPEDARAKLVHITRQGTALLGQTIAAMKAAYAQMPAAFGVERLAQVAPVLADLRRLLDAERNARDGFSPK
jgi:DNA-binding MarR family transcriptional regulator